MEITPEKIKEIFNNATPYQRDDIMKNYVGQKICWDLNFTEIVQKVDSSLLILLKTPSNHTGVSCNIDENLFPLIKIIPSGTPVRLVGTIDKISDFGVIKIKEAKLHEIDDEINQIYFPYGSREELVSFLEGKILGAKNIIIYDSYPGEDILKLLESALPKAEIKLLGKIIDEEFLKKINAFNLYFNQNIDVKKTNISHARFYIINDEVLQVDSSLKNFGGNKTTMVHIINPKIAETIKKDFDKWWNEAT
ncbi:MAG: hypothetical protein WC428_03715 [Candidatus Paceibacterota bacterium]|jgi:hypothetical protein